MHPEKIASRCKHSIHPSSSLRTPSCPRCVTSTAQADLEQIRTEFEAEGGVNAPARMRNQAWNIARLRWIMIERRAKKTMEYDRLRQEREGAWEEAHRQYLVQEQPSLDGVSDPACEVCIARKKPDWSYAKPIVPLTRAWWEREGALVVDQIIMPGTSDKTTSKQRPPEAQSKHPSYLRDLIQSYRSLRTVSDIHRRSWENHCKIDRAVRRKYDLDDDFDIHPGFLALPIPASHARYHHTQTQNDLFAGERRANRLKRRKENYKPSRSSLALSELADAVDLSETELDKLRLAEEVAKLQRLTNVVATEVGFLYLVGDTDLFKKWKADVEQSNLSLIYRKEGPAMEGQSDGDHGAEDEDEDEDEDEAF
ncbi:hypothetical protein C7974DRAFT_376785 [Boeremia exigua]|uniref:uncharacterized protein n=1 Tax=Boeremia exigua TaxID=749465 RepID=UPI001E8D925C|nr:uncharacterized protein C7974DRAFT_376785 [Boeremia exigua]KAH6625242.1 hypothetical protein C7974DRAFT_376785 [Boeremia exigua]